MRREPQHSAAAGITTVVAGAGLGGLVASLAAPGFFPAALIGGALLAGALRVAWILVRSESHQRDGVE